MATMQPSIITPPRVPLVNTQTGVIDDVWFLFLNQLNRNAGDISKAVVITADDQTWSFPNSIILTPVVGELERLLDPASFTLGLADTTIAAGDYGDASHLVKITFDAKGRATSAQQYGLNSDNVTEGSTNLFFTNARARAALSGGAGIDYDNTTGVIALDPVPGVAGTYTTFTSLTINAYGQITAITP